MCVYIYIYTYTHVYIYTYIYIVIYTHLDVVEQTEHDHREVPPNITNKHEHTNDNKQHKPTIISYKLQHINYKL